MKLTKRQKAARAECEHEAKLMIAKMVTKGWRFRVWENCGWNCAIYNGYVTIYPDGPESYHGMIGDAYNEGACATLAVWSHERSYRDPNIAAYHATRAARRYVDKLTKIVRGAESVTIDKGTAERMQSFWRLPRRKISRFTNASAIK